MIKKIFYVSLVGLAMLSCKDGDKNSTNKSNSQFKNDDEKASYVIGMSIGENLKSQGIDKYFNIDSFVKGIKDKFENKATNFDQDSISTFMQKYLSDVLEKNKKINKEEEDKFLAKNKTEKGVVTTASGLQYLVIKDGEGAKPTDEDLVTVKYEGKTLDGEVFDGTDKYNKGNAAEIPLNGVIPGWKEGLKLMTKGAKYKFFIPSDLAYKDNGPFGPNKTLIFEVELIDFKKAPKQDATNNAKTLTPEQLEQLKQQMNKK